MKAFPTVSGQTGMDLRDYFAAKAMQGIISKFGNKPPYLDEDNPNETEDDEVVRWAYELADAMLKAREGNE